MAPSKLLRFAEIVHKGRANGFWAPVSNFSQAAFLTSADAESAAQPSQKPLPPPLPSTFDAALGMAEATLAAHVAPKTRLLSKMLELTRSSDEVDKASDVLSRLKIENAAYRKQLQNHRERVSLAFVSACLRAETPRKAFPCLAQGNKLGFNPSLGAAHVLLRYAAKSADKDLLLDVLKRAVEANVRPTPNTADIIFRGLRRVGDRPLLFKFADEFRANGVRLKSAEVELLMDEAANEANKTLASKFMIERLSMVSPVNGRTIVPVIKTHLLHGDVDAAVEETTKNFAMEPEEGSKKKRLSPLSLRNMVLLWPLALRRSAASLPSEAGDVESLLAQLKSDMVRFFEELNAQGLHVSVDVETEFGAGIPKAFETKKEEIGDSSKSESVDKA